MKKTTIYIIRHGESLGNANGIMLGHTDLDLSEHGYKQANATADYLKDVKIDAIYSSDLLRAYNTAVPHAKHRNLSVIADVELRELCVGEWEGKTPAYIIEKYGNMFIDDWHGGFGTFEFPGGEGVMSGGNRFFGEVLRLAMLHEGETILIASHAAVIRAFWSIISGIAPEDIVGNLSFPTNASYSVAEFDGEKITPVEYSHDEHLESVGITRIVERKR